MAATPLAAANAHMATINTKQSAQLAETVAFPFIHMQPNDDKAVWATPTDLPDMSRAPFSRSEIQEMEILATSGDLVVYSLTFQRFDDNGDAALLVQGLWGVYRIDGEWKVAWRQYLGPI